MIFPLFKRNVSSVIKVFFILFAILCIYTTVIIYMYNPELSDMLSGYQDVLPGMMSAVGMTGIAANLLDWIQIYLYGFIMMLFPMIFAVILGNKLLMGDIDRGSLASLLSTPHSRLRIIVTQAVTGIMFILLLMAAITGVGIATCEVLFPGELDIAHYVELNASALLLQLAVFGIVFAFACLCSESKYYYLFGAGLPFVFLLLQMLSNIGEKMENLKYFTLYTLFRSKIWCREPEPAGHTIWLWQELQSCFSAEALHGSAEETYPYNTLRGIVPILSRTHTAISFSPRFAQL